MLYTNNDLGRFAKDPAVIELDGYYYMYHSIMIDKTLGIGVARSDDGDSFELIAGFPLTQECEKNGVGAPGAALYSVLRYASTAASRSALPEAYSVTASVSSSVTS